MLQGTVALVWHMQADTPVLQTCWDAVLASCTRWAVQPCDMSKNLQLVVDLMRAVRRKFVFSEFIFLPCLHLRFNLWD